jgi:ankyrin repeat protein
MATPDLSPDDEASAGPFLRLIALGTLDEIRLALAARPELAHAVGPHPFWGGHPQPLHVAIEAGRDEVVELLLAAGADPNGSNDRYDGWSPLMLAVRSADTATRDALIARGARIGLVESLLLADDTRTRECLDGVTALPADAPNGGSLMAFARTPDAIDGLLALGVSAVQPDRWGATPLDAMSRLGARGASLVAHLTALGVAAPPPVYARLGDQAALEAIHARDAALVADDAVLMAAVELRHQEVVSWLLAHGARAGARALPPSRHTALHAAAWNGDAAMVQLLLRHGADPSARDDEHHGTPADWARVAVDVTRNQACAAVADYLDGAGRTPPG